MCHSPDGETQTGVVKKEWREGCVLCIDLDILGISTAAITDCTMTEEFAIAEQIVSSYLLKLAAW